MVDNDIALMAHLMRRAGFGAQYDELEARAAKGYEATLEELLHPDDQRNGRYMRCRKAACEGLSTGALGDSKGSWAPESLLPDG